MCGIWAEPRKRIFPLDLFSRILQDSSMKSLRHVALTGGEPFLLPNLEDYYAAARAHAPQAYINISTNGSLTERTMRFL
ncbi:4Fe-4S cluster-binding domain-containing protein, partial [Candidatus Woesearchaeota archaeon]|nr:4Fe-4S cluster-binding domain-containing protein [Candidatus Woesearchaeota archaeon]